jgi:YfiH family protein
MPFNQKNGIRYFTFNSLAREDLVHAIFTRRGGVSPKPWEGLNVGLTVGDSQENVEENKIRSFQIMGRNYNSVFDSWLEHGTRVLYATEPRSPEWMSPPKGDVILTNNPHVTLFMRFADCVPILLYDPKQAVVGIVHSGWQGTVQRVAAIAVQAMQERFSSFSNDIVACIGPSIGPNKYEVGVEVTQQIRKTFGHQAANILPHYGDAVHLDLWAANRLVLEQAGVNQIEVAEICTATHLEDWFSHRAERGRTGRFGALIALNVE